MTEDTLLPFDLPAVAGKKLTVGFDGGQLSSDGGLLLSRRAQLFGYSLMLHPIYHSLWAKTSSSEKSTGTHESSARYHPIAFHALDVAAVAESTILREWTHFAQLARRLGTDTDRLLALTLWLVAMHDIGKASSGFQLKAKELWDDQRLGAAPAQPTCKQFHGDMTAWYLGHDNDSQIDGEPLSKLVLRLLPWPVSSVRAVIDAIAGHHGRPVAMWGEEPPGKPVPVRRVGKALVTAARDLGSDLARLWGVAPVGASAEKGAHIAYAWWLAVLLPFCDWIGSNSDYFQPDDNWQPLTKYWSNAKDAAGRALSGLELIPAAVSVPALEHVLPDKEKPSPVQEWADTVQLPPEGPILAIIEDATGSGKTEAALILAHRLMRGGHGRGFFVALPTMATANAMHARLQPVYRRLFEAAPSLEFGTQPSLALAHGKAALLRRGNHEEAVAAYCSEWISAESRRAFFAQAGAGTIDQAILAVLPSKFQTLRLRGLSDKILIVDEAHAFDAYMSVEIAASLRFHAAQGGSAILLSATLPLQKRAELARAFAEGASRPIPKLTGTAYPLMTLVAPTGASEERGTTRSGTERSVEVRRIASLGDGEALALEAASRGAAVALIRTTVDEAIASLERLREAAPADVTVQLFHARFMHGDRQRIETDVVVRFGRDGTPEQRQRRILVATAVIEQSLDIDFDVLVTDLAPVDLLVQRAGRLWRHERDRGYCSTDSRAMHVISEDPCAKQGDKWLEDVLPQAVWVYKDPKLLWLSAEAIFATGAISTKTLAGDEACPSHPRRLVERVYGERPSVMDESLYKDDAEGRRLAHQYQARAAVLDPRRPYQHDGTPWAEEGFVRTRLGDSVTVRLAREVDGRLLPLAADHTDDWSFSEVRVSPRMAAGLAPPSDAEKRRLEPRWRESDNAVLLVLRDGDENQCRNVASGHSYTAITGLRRDLH